MYSKDIRKQKNHVSYYDQGISHHSDTQTTLSHSKFNSKKEFFKKNAASIVSMGWENG